MITLLLTLLGYCLGSHLGHRRGVLDERRRPVSVPIESVSDYEDGYNQALKDVQETMGKESQG